MLYLNDLRESMREDTIAEIKRSRPDLVPMIEMGDDIQIGTYFTTDDYELV